MRSWDIDVMMLRSELIFREYAERTQDIYIKTVTDFLEYTDKDTDAIRREDVIRYLDNRLEFDSNNTVLVKLNAIEFFFEEILGLDITVNIRKYTRQYTGRIVSLEELNILLVSIPVRDRILLKLLLLTGKHPKIVLNWKVQDIHHHDGSWHIGKHILPMDLAKEIMAYIEREEKESYLFSAKKERMCQANVYAFLRRYTEQFLGRQVSLTELRHTVAYELWKQGKKKEFMDCLGNVDFPNIRQWYKKRGIILKKD